MLGERGRERENHQLWQMQEKENQGERRRERERNENNEMGRERKKMHCMLGKQLRRVRERGGERKKNRERKYLRHNRCWKGNMLNGNHLTKLFKTIDKFEFFGEFRAKKIERKNKNSG